MSRNRLHHKQKKDSIVRVNKDKSMLFGKTNKIDDLLVSYIRKKDSVQLLSHVRLFTCLTLHPVHHQLPELAQTQAHQIGGAIEPSQPLLFHFPPAFDFSQHQGLFRESVLHIMAWGQSIGASASASVLPTNIQD